MPSVLMSGSAHNVAWRTSERSARLRPAIRNRGVHGWIGTRFVAVSPPPLLPFAVSGRGTSEAGVVLRWPKDFRPRPDVPFAVIAMDAVCAHGQGNNDPRRAMGTSSVDRG